MVSYFRTSTLLKYFYIRHQLGAYTNWIDVCPGNGNLLASGGDDGTIQIYDNRASKINISLEVSACMRRYIIFSE